MQPWTKRQRTTDTPSMNASMDLDGRSEPSPRAPTTSSRSLVGSAASIASVAAMTLALGVGALGCGDAANDGEVDTAEVDHTTVVAADAAGAPSVRGARPFLRPRGITLEVPWEHVNASGGRDSVAKRARFDGVAFAGPGEPPLKVFLNRNGGTYRPGQDDSRQNTSIVPRQNSTIPAWPFGDNAWDSLKECVTAQFAPFHVTIVDQEPPSNERYVEHVVGGLPQDVGLPNGVGGVAPIDNFNCRVLDVAINFTFAEVYGGNVQAICETAAQEIAHSFSLDHELYCPDPMTYLGGCGDKTFRDVDVQCGEFQPRACNCNRATQNSVQLMLEKLGPAGGAIEPPPVAETVPPVVSITSPVEGANLPQNSTLIVSANATDNAGIAATELVWDFTGDVFACPTNFGGGAVTCTRTGAVSTWNVRVGQGQRRFSVRARDTSGNVAETSKRTITLGADGVPQPTDTTAPQATVLSPADGAIVAANTAMQVSASVTDDVALASVELLWTFTGDTFPCPFSGQAVSCDQVGSTFLWTLSVGVGLRAFQIRAIDTAGNTTITGERTIELSADGVPVNPGDPDTVGEANNSPADAFGIRCGNALDLVVAADNDDWFAIDAPAATAVQVALFTQGTQPVAVAMFTAAGQDTLASSTDIAADGGEVRAISAGPVILARVSVAAGASSYRLTATCSREGGDIPNTGEDDDFEDNDDVDYATRAFCGQEHTELIAADRDFFVVNVRDQDTLTVQLSGTGANAVILDANGTTLSSTGASVVGRDLEAGDVVIRVEPEDGAAFYDIAFVCTPGPLTAQGGCGCRIDNTTSAPEAAFGLVGLGLLRRRRRAHTAARSVAHHEDTTARLIIPILR